jgi:Mce-associated membrane protein
VSDENRTEKNDGEDAAVTLEKSSETDAERAPAGGVALAPGEPAGEKIADGDAAAGASGDTAAPVPSGRKGVPRVLAGALVTVAVVLAAVVGGLAYGKIQDNAAEAARTDAVTAAEEQAVAVLAYSHDKIDEQVAAAAEGLTGDFREEYLNLMNNVIAPGAKERSITVQAAVQASSIVSADADHAVAMLFVNTITTSSDNPEAVSSGSRVRVELENEDGRWLVNGLGPI